MKTKVTEIFGIDTPIFAFSHCRDVVAEATRAGGMGVLGASRYSPEELEQELKWIDAHTDGRPYGVDLVLPGKMEKVPQFAHPDTLLPREHVDFVNGVLDRGGVPPLPPREREKVIDRLLDLVNLTHEGAMMLVEVALRHPQVKLFVSALGIAPKEMIDYLHRRGLKVGALVGKPEHAVNQVKAGIDIIVAQGMEAGGHTGNITSMVLWPQIVDAVAPIPVLAAGGVGRGRQMAAAIALGAEGVWCGSIWLGTRQSELSAEMKECYFEASSEDAVQRTVLTGKQCRMLRSKLTEAWLEPGAPKTLPMPLQRFLMAESRARVERARRKDFMSYYVGQIVGDMKQETSVRDVIRDMLVEFADSCERLAGMLQD